MSFMTRVRYAVIRWWIRVSQERPAHSTWDDLEGMGRRLARPPLPRAAHAPAVAEERSPAPRAPLRVIRWEI